MSDQKFFVVRRFQGREHFSYEHGDFESKYSKEEKRAIIYRGQMQKGDETSLNDAIAAYKRGVRLKPPPAPPPVEKPKDKNSIREKYLAKLRAEATSRAE